MDKLIHFLSSYKTSIVLMLIYATGLATATFVEKKMSTEAAKMLIYYSPLFILLQFLLVINFLLILVRYNYIKRKKWVMIVLHVALIVILGGALTTFLFGKEGQVHIREGEKIDQMVMHTSRGIKTETLPFVLELTDFRLNRYPGSQSPSSYESDLLVHINGKVVEEKVYMNNVLDVEGYRFFQASYDQDEAGTILSVNRDVAGRTITYAGYSLLLAGFLLMFFMPDSRFRKLARQLSEARENVQKMVVAAVLLSTPFLTFGETVSNRSIKAVDSLMPNLVEQLNALTMSGKSVSKGIQQIAIPADHAARFGMLPVQFRGRVMPMNTFSSEILRKIYQEKTIGSLTSDQFLLSLLSLPQIWMQVPFIALPNDQISLQYNLPKGYASYSHFFDPHGNYRLLPSLQQIYHQPVGRRTTVEKDLIKLDERVNIVYQLFNLGMPGIFPNANDPSHKWYAPVDDLSLFPVKDSLFISGIFDRYLSEVQSAFQRGNWSKPDMLLDEIGQYQRENDKASLIHSGKLEAELRYNQMNIFGRCKTGYFIFGVILLGLAFMQLLRRQKWIRNGVGIFVVFIVALFLYHTTGMVMRWYISGYAPWSNSYETMVYVAWATLLAGLIFGRKSSLTLALASLFGGVILFVSGLNWMDPQINTLVPVLKSPWLMFHVAVIVAAYGFFGISFLLGITNLFIMIVSKKNAPVSFRIRELSIINSLSLLIGLALMTVGTFLGAVWANESWGRYWGWDPKETWALITIVVYSIVTHLHLVKKWYNDWSFNLLSVFAFTSVLMTFLGVNYFLSGMHSYGQTENVSSVFLYIAVAFAAIGILGVAAYRRWSQTSGYDNTL
ncbi:cytochrome c biogenesis protein CcsA [Proteiniphilum sp. UBA1028]|uniref:cytochrome c biogenesis protein CcsA n=1 Tax=Proteiniphilum sp. UBA1028 TaxID=1947251 RepID=UPI000E9A80B0|nr:cytochrome c biogenesis protein CcsA [Proteiniphilum sp. UBA1028]HBG56437.1 cytochrome C biogenesis protein [Porphyromonadaceae bacterium]